LNLFILDPIQSSVSTIVRAQDTGGLLTTKCWICTAFDSRIIRPRFLPDFCQFFLPSQFFLVTFSEHVLGEARKRMCTKVTSDEVINWVKKQGDDLQE